MIAYKLTFAYDGMNYIGWQVQSTKFSAKLSIQSVIQEKLSLIVQAPVNLTGAGRTDAGVHALGQTAHIQLPESIDIYRLKHSLNALLPPDIRLLEMERVEEDFHARYKAKGKIYAYHLALQEKPDLFKRKYQWHIPYRNFSIERMKEGAERLLGEHDFKGFASENHRGSASYDSIRCLKRLDVHEGDEIVLTFEADGFLYKMVRNMVGTLVDIGRGYYSKEVINKVLETKDRRLAGQTAPAHALFLVRVVY